MKIVKTTVGCVIEKDNKILLALRNHEPFKEHWCIPGGHIEYGEKVTDAVKREVKEETGLEIEPIFFNYYTEFYKDIGWHAVALIFVSKAFGKIKKQAEEIKDIKWLSKKEIFNMPLAFEHKKILKDYFEKEK